MKSIYLNFSVKTSATAISYRFVSTISLTLLCFSSPLLIIHTASAQTPDNTNLEQTAVTSLNDVVSTLIKVLQSENVEARIAAARALGGMGTQAKIAEAALTVALYDKEPRVRYSAASAIANLGGDTKNAFPVLVKALEDESKWIRHDAAYALSNIALNLQGKVRDLSAKELNQAVTNFENSLKVMEDSKLEIPPQAIKSINDSLDTLKREKQRQ
ncbi:MAG: HEAT repeat domain-containing protein [Nostocales cyanobacterium 94392]|nr:HEAT repeat domain-containing protein [Nostocales cyanobacterium 94392]